MDKPSKTNDPVVQKIYQEFDRAEKAVKKDVMDDAIIDLYKDIYGRAVKGEFTREQLEAIQARAEKSKEFIEEIKLKLQEKAVDNSDRHNKIQSYLKNSF